MRDATRQQLEKLVDAYNLLVKGIEKKAEESEDRALGGIIRAGKGLLVENMATHLVEAAWFDMGQPASRLHFQKETVIVPIKPEYVKKVKNPEVAKWIQDNIHDFKYATRADVHINIDSHFVCGIECKAYTENAMMKRILVDFTLLRQIIPDLACILFQLESQLGGDYGQPAKPVILGSKQTHTLMSYFDVDLHIVTLLEGDRKVDQPIHKVDYYKELKLDLLEKAMLAFQTILKKWA